MQIKNLKVHGLEESIVRSGYPHQLGEPPELDLLIPGQVYSKGNVKRIDKLSGAPQGSGHDGFLIGVTVKFDLRYPQYWTKHLQRYHWFQLYSGQSIMHSITHDTDIKGNCNEWVLDNSSALLDYLVNIYNTESEYPVEVLGKTVASRKEMFHVVISNCPMGYRLWVPITTNYLQLKTMYNQRKGHRLFEWKRFCEWIETLPMSYLITKKQHEEITI
jgi:hypothetical protein